MLVPETVQISSLSILGADKVARVQCACTLLLLCAARVPDHLGDHPMASDWSDITILPSDWPNLNNVRSVF